MQPLQLQGRDERDTEVGDDVHDEGEYGYDDDVDDADDVDDEDDEGGRLPQR